jgi:predicted esterase
MLFILVCVLAFVTCNSGDEGYNIPGIESEFVNANPDKGFNYGYYYYVPQSIRNSSKKFLLVETNNTSLPNDDMAVHDESAKRTFDFLKGWADRIGCALLVPVFDRPRSNYLMNPQQLNRLALQTKTGKLARVDLQLIKMVEDVKERCEAVGIHLEQKILMNGYSSSGEFANRFTAIHPELVQAVASGGINYMSILPINSLEGERLIYRVGIADLQEITGVPFNLEQYKTVPQLLHVGSEDKLDTLPYSDSFGDDERRIITKVLGLELRGRWEKCKRIFEEQGCNAQFVIYNGSGHEYTNEIINDLINFFKNNIK